MRLEIGGKARGDDQGGLDLPAHQQGGNLVHVASVGIQVDVLTGGDLADESARGLALIVIQHRQRHVLDFHGQGVSHEQQHQGRGEKDQDQRAAVAENMVEFFAGYRPDMAHAHPASILRIKEIKASSMRAGATRMLRRSMLASCRARSISGRRFWPSSTRTCSDLP